MRNPVDYAISHARLTIATLLFLLVAGFSAYVSHPEGGRAGRHDPDRLRQRHAARHQPGGRRAADPEAARDAAEVGRERQGDALRRLRGRRLRAARIRGGLRFRRRARRRARQGRRRQERPAERRRRAAGRRRSTSRSSRCSSWRSAATCRSARCSASRARRRRRSSRSRACSPPTCAAPATRRWRSSPSRCSCRATASRSTS